MTKQARTQTEHPEPVEVVEKTMTKVAEREGNVALLAKLDWLRRQVRAAFGTRIER